MFRVANIVMVGALLITAAVVYQLKYASTADAERLASLRAAIRKERDAISVMRAEWARRTSPFYIQGLVERHLDLRRLDVDSISDLDNLPPKTKGSGDGIGGMIEALEDTPLVTSSTGKVSRPTPDGGAPAAPASAGGAASVPATSALRPKPSVQPKPAARPATPMAAVPAPLTTGSVTPRPVAPSAPPAASEAAEPESPVATFFKGFLSGR